MLTADHIEHSDVDALADLILSPDFDSWSLDPDHYRALANALLLEQGRVQSLTAEVTKLKAELARQHGGPDWLQILRRAGAL